MLDTANCATFRTACNHRRPSTDYVALALQRSVPGAVIDEFSERTKATLPPGLLRPVTPPTLGERGFDYHGLSLEGQLKELEAVIDATGVFGGVATHSTPLRVSLRAYLEALGQKLDQ